MTDFERTRALFHIPAGVLYMDGNSLGPLPVAAERRVAGMLRDEWGEELIRGWNSAGWFMQPRRVGDRIGRLIGAPEGTVVMGDTLSIKVFQALASALDLNPGRSVILSDSGNFPSDLYMAEGLIGLLGDAFELRIVEPEAVEAAIDDTVAVLMLTEVDYRTGRLHDMQALTRKAHAAGALTVWDLAHSAGALPVDVTAAEADFAVGCTYKYLNGGPGAPAFIYVAPRHAGKARPALSGWMGHEAPFAFDLGYRPGLGIERMRCGTPPVLCAHRARRRPGRLGRRVDRRRADAVDPSRRGVHPRGGGALPGARPRLPQGRRAPRQPGLDAPSRGLCHHAGTDRARRHRRFSRAGCRPLRLHPALSLGKRRHEGGGYPPRHHGEPPVGPPRIPAQGPGHMSRSPIDPAREGAETSFEERMAYGDYLRLDRLLEAQEPLSKAHDEVLFIIQHQVSELWMKLAIHEISSAMRAIRDDELRPAFKMLTRVARVFEQLNNSWDVLRTMTPSEYTEFRGALGQSSGFQSWQYRAVEFLVGNRNAAMLRPHSHRPEVVAELERILAAPSLYDEALMCLARNGFDIGVDAHRTDWREMRGENPKVVAAWKEVYAATRTALDAL